MTGKNIVSLLALTVTTVLTIATSPPYWSEIKEVTYEESILLSPANPAHEIDILLSTDAQYQNQLSLSLNFTGTHDGDSSGVLTLIQLDESGSASVSTSDILQGNLNQVATEFDLSLEFIGDIPLNETRTYRIDWDGAGSISATLLIRAKIDGDGERPEENIPLTIEVQ